MPRQKVVEKTIESAKNIEWVSITTAWEKDPIYTLHWILHQPLFVGCISFLAAFFFKVMWDIMRDNSRETAKVAMLNMMSAFSKDQHDARLRQEDRISGLISKIEAKSSQNVVDTMRIEHTLDKIDSTLTAINARVEKVEKYVETHR